MPQASRELTEKWDGPDQSKAQNHLEQNFTLTKDFYWIRKDPLYTPTEEDLSAVQFLTEEWDYGGIPND